MILHAMSLLAATAGEVGSGKIKGGWEFVWGAYVFTWAVLLLYMLSLWVRWPKKSSTKGA